MVAGAFQPKRSAASTSAGAPTFRPSGANTELHEWAKELRKLPPQNSPFAFSSSTPSMIAWDSMGNSVEGLTRLRSSAAAVVTSLKVDPGGCGAEKAMPARARISPFRGSSAATPPSLPASATTAASWSPVWMVVRIAFAGRGCARARTRLPATSSPPGRPRSRSSKASSRPLWPTGQSAGKPRAYSALRSSAVSCGSMRPAIESAIPTSGEVRASASAPRPGPCRRSSAGWRARPAHSAESGARPHAAPGTRAGGTSPRDRPTPGRAGRPGGCRRRASRGPPARSPRSRPPPRDRPPRARSSSRWRPRGGTRAGSARSESARSTPRSAAHAWRGSRRAPRRRRSRRPRARWATGCSNRRSHRPRATRPRVRRAQGERDG